MGRQNANTCKLCTFIFIAAKYWRCKVYCHITQNMKTTLAIVNRNYTLRCWARCIVRLRRLQDGKYCSTLKSCAISDILRTPTILFKRQHTQFDLGKCRYHFAQTSKRNKIIQQKYICSSRGGGATQHTEQN